MGKYAGQKAGDAKKTVQVLLIFFVLFKLLKSEITENGGNSNIGTM